MFDRYSAWKVGSKVRLGGGLGQNSGSKLKKLKAFRPDFILAVVLVLLFSGPFFCVPLALAQGNDVPAWRLSITPVAPAPEDGHYAAGDDVEFWIDHQGARDNQSNSGNARLRFVEDEEIFYLTSDPSTLGGRILKYDNGDAALAVSSWGGVTLYTRNAPNGLPAERMGEAPNLDPVPVAANELQDQALAITEALEESDDLDVGIAANWDRVVRGNRVRSLTIESIRNATNALAELARKAETRSTLAERIRLVRIVVSDQSDIRVGNQTLTISFDANGEPWDRPSSRAIIEAIESNPSD